MTRDTILIEREYEGERCGEQGGRCPLMYRYYEDYVCPLTGEHEWLEWSAEIEGYRRCPSCLRTPAATVLTDEQRRIIRSMFRVIDSIGPEEEIAEAKSAFPWLEAAK